MSNNKIGSCFLRADTFVESGVRYCVCGSHYEHDRHLNGSQVHTFHRVVVTNIIIAVICRPSLVLKYTCRKSVTAQIIYVVLKVWINFKDLKKKSEDWFKVLEERTVLLVNVSRTSAFVARECALRTRDNQLQLYPDLSGRWCIASEAGRRVSQSERSKWPREGNKE